MTTPGNGEIDVRAQTPAERVRLLRLINAPIEAPVGSRAYEKRMLQRQILLRYEIGGHARKAVVDALGISLRQFYRERRLALEWIQAGIERPARIATFEPVNLFEAERLTLERLAPDLPFGEAKRGFETLLSRQTDPLLRVLGHLALYEFLAARDERAAIRRERTSLRERIALVADEPARGLARARANIVDTHVAWRDGSYGDAVRTAEDTATLVRPFADAGSPDHAALLCTALQLRAQLRWETGGATDALAALDQAADVIGKHRLHALPCAVTNAVGRSDLLMRRAENVSYAVGVATAAFDHAAIYGDAEDAAGALLIIAMARCGQGHHASALEHAAYALEFADEIAPVGRVRLLVHAAEIAMATRSFSLARRLLERARSLVPIGSTADAQRQLRVALLAALSGAAPDGLIIVDEALATLEAQAAHRFIGPGLKIRATIRRALGDELGSVEDLENAVCRLRGESYAWTYAQALAQYGRAAKKPALRREASDLHAAMSGP